jgi:hypothetical protein
MVDTTQADFDQGVNEDVAITDGGELALGPNSTTFKGSSLPSGWNWAPSNVNVASSVTVTNGKLTISNARVDSSLTMAPGQSLTFRGAFSGGSQTIGFTTIGAQSGQGTFGTGTTANESFYGAGSTRYPIASLNLAGQTVTMRLDWGATSVRVLKLEQNGTWTQLGETAINLTRLQERGRLTLTDGASSGTLEAEYVNVTSGYDHTEDFDGPPAGWLFSNTGGTHSETFDNGIMTAEHGVGFSPVAAGPGLVADVRARIDPVPGSGSDKSRIAIQSRQDGNWVGFETLGTSIYSFAQKGYAKTYLATYGTTLNGAMHHYRIEWYADHVVVSVPDVPSVAPFSFNIAIGGHMTPTIQNAKIDSFHLTSLAGSVNESGNFSSRIFDAGALTRWDKVTWAQQVPANTSVQMQVRTGNTATPDGTWSAWETSYASGDALSLPKGRYAQYKVDMTSSSTFDRPSVQSVQMWPADPVVDLGDTTNADFAAGHMVDADLAYIGDGAIGMFTGFTSDPNATTVDSSWTAANPSGLSMNSGSMHVNGTDARQINKSYMSVPNGQILTMNATFNGNQKQSFGIRESRPAVGTQAISAYFEYSPTEQVLRTIATRNGVGSPPVIDAYAMNLTGQPNTLAINWSGNGWVGFDVNGSRLYPAAGGAYDSISVGMPTSQFTPWVSDPSGDTDPLVIHSENLWSVGSGTFTSRVIGNGAATYQGDIDWNADVPTGTTMTVEVRSGDTFDPDGTWSEWELIENGDELPEDGLFVQYRLAMTGTPPDAFPVLRDITFSVLE